jgi:hypothetical protein
MLYRIMMYVPYCCLFLSWKSRNWFEYVGGVFILFLFSCCCWRKRGNGIFLAGILLILIYLLTAVGLSPGGKTYLHTSTTLNNTNNNQTTWSAFRASSLRVLPWHLPYNCGKSTENLSQSKKNLSQVKKKTQSQYSIHIISHVLPVLLV